MLDDLLMMIPSAVAKFRDLGAEALIQFEAKKLEAFTDDGEGFESGFYSADSETGIATINIAGTLTPKPSFSARFFGGGNTTYQDIISAFAQAEVDANVKEIIMNIDSGGGSISGMFEAMDFIAEVKKPVKAVIGNITASAAYGLASQADEIVAASDVSRIGSIGVVQQLFVSEAEVTITSKDAPNKRPDATTKEGKKAIQQELDDIAEKFAERIAAGRSRATGQELDAEFVHKNFGRGGVFLTEKAIDSKMVDGMITKKNLKLVSNSSKNKNNAKADVLADENNSLEQHKMTLEEIKAQNPALYAQILALGVATEKDRCAAHVEMGKAYGANDFALECIANGADLTTQTIQAKYFAAGVNKQDLSAAASDDAAADDASDTQETDASSAADAKTLKDKEEKEIADHVVLSLGGKIEA